MKPATAEKVSPRAIDTLMAVIRVYHRDGRCTLRSVMAEIGLSQSRTYTLLNELREKEWVTWEEGTNGTLRPTVTWPYAKEHQ